METTRPAITATGLSWTYGYRGAGFRAVRDVDPTLAAEPAQRSWARRARAPRPSCSAWPGPTGRPLDGWSVTGRSCRAAPRAAGPGRAARRVLVEALAQHPDVVVADEPTADLDATSAKAMIDALGALVDRLGVTVAVATRDPRLAQRADRVLPMEAGSLIADSAEGDQPSVLADPRSAVTERRLELALP